MILSQSKRSGQSRLKQAFLCVIYGAERRDHETIKGGFRDNIPCRISRHIGFCMGESFICAADSALNDVVKSDH